MIRQIMRQYMGYRRSIRGLEIARGKLHLLEEKIDEVKANNYHELTRAHEAIDLLKYCQLMLGAVIARKGMRGFYNLVDYPPKLDPELRSKYVVLSQENQEQKVTLESIEQDMEMRDAAGI